MHSVLFKSIRTLSSKTDKFRVKKFSAAGTDTFAKECNNDRTGLLQHF
jgi:hypothetical protein